MSQHGDGQQSESLTWKQIAERFSLKFVRNVTVASVKTVYNKRLSSTFKLHSQLKCDDKLNHQLAPSSEPS